MLRIYKYQVQAGDDFEIRMPHGARVLSVATQHDEPQIWALVDDESRAFSPRKFKLLGTGHPADHIATDRYVGTFQVRGGALVFHLFEVLE